jgi:hypothetical protein
MVCSQGDQARLALQLGDGVGQLLGAERFRAHPARPARERNDRMNS